MVIARTAGDVERKYNLIEKIGLVKGLLNMYIKDEENNIYLSFF